MSVFVYMFNSNYDFHLQKSFLSCPKTSNPSDLAMPVYIGLSFDIFMHVFILLHTQSAYQS